MQIISTSIPGVKIIEPDIHRDGRGYFCETYNRERYFNADVTAVPCQVTKSRSHDVTPSKTATVKSPLRTPRVSK